MRFRSRRRSFRRFSRARRIVRAVSGITLSKRIVLDGVTIPAESAVNYDNPLKVSLLRCIEAQDEAVESDGTNIADAPLYSRLVKLRLQFGIRGNAGQNFRWMLVKFPDGDDSITSLANNGQFHVSDETTSGREIRKNILSKGFFMLNSSALAGNIPIRVSRQALRRMGSLRETDVISFVIASDSSASASLHGFGTIWVKANG